MPTDLVTKRILSWFRSNFPIEIAFAMLVAAAVLVACTLSLTTPPPLLTRRAAATALASAAAAALPPLRAHAGLFGSELDGPFREIQLSQTRLKELASKLKSKELKGDSADDSIVVLQTVTVQLSGTVKVMDKATTQMTLLSEVDLSKARSLSARLESELSAIKQGCREQKADQQIAGAEAAGSVLGEYLTLAGSKYTLPEVVSMELPAAGSSEFISQYLGIFSCEGQGLERIPGSNSCRNSADKSQNKNPMPTKNFLDFDFLTGKAL